MEYKGYKIFKDAYKQIRYYSIKAKEEDPGMDYEFANSLKDAKKRIDKLVNQKVKGGR